MTVSVTERVEEEASGKYMAPPFEDVGEEQEVNVESVMEREEERVEPTENREGSDDVEVMEVNKDEVKITDCTTSFVLV